ncbi:MAG: glucans biosynthesis glucosyltransferase MdoH [Pelagibaca sp.]
MVLTLLGAACISTIFALSIVEWTGASLVAFVLIGLGAIWISGGAATSVLGLLQQQVAPVSPSSDWQPVEKTAILVLLCGEDARPLAKYLSELHRGLNRRGFGQAAEIFVLSDTNDPDHIAAEETALSQLVEDGTITYRRRLRNVGRKPGNIADWLASSHSRDYAYMLVLDADSRMSAARIMSLIYRLESKPRLGLLQAGMTLLPARSHFGKHQRVASRLLSQNFGRGLAAWSGEAGNYWGHNAIMRIAAFRSAAQLPVLSGRAPFGGPPLSHDFIEAAWMRRAGWAIELDPETWGSAEDGPQTLSEFHKRDRRWCQGNLQHIRLITEPGLDIVSRLHLASGIASYLAAPVWLALVLLVATGAVRVEGALPYLVVTAIILLPKLCALGYWLARARTVSRRRLVLRASFVELLLSTVIAPLMMLRQSGSVLSVLAGRDCGWKSPNFSRLRMWRGVPEVAVGSALVGLAFLTEPASSALWLLPVVLPMLSAPILLGWLDRGAKA